MVSILNISNGIKEPTCGSQNCNATQILIFGGYVKMSESLYTRVIIWVITILYHTEIRVVLCRYEGSCIVYRSKWFWKQKCHQILIPYWYQKMWNRHHSNLNGIKEKTIPDQHWWKPISNSGNSINTEESHNQHSSGKVMKVLRKQ